MQYQVARGNMRMIAEMGKRGQLDMLGISIDDFEKLIGETVWLGSDRQRVSQTLNSLMYGTCDVIGVPRFEIPAEFIAAAIAIFVAPVNTHVACRFAERSGTAMDLGRGVDEPDKCTAKQLFALVTQLVADPMNSHAKHLFERNTGLKIENAVKKQLKERSAQNGKNT